jgi:hypothetical protein
MNTKSNSYAQKRTLTIQAKSIIGLFILFNAVAVHAQNSITALNEKLTLGAKVGFNYANVWDEQGQDFNADAKVGLAGGLFAGIPLGKYIGFQPEFLMSQKGFDGSGTLLGTGYTMTRTTTYLDVPLQLQIKPTGFITLLIGPQYSYLLHQKDVYKLGANSYEQEQEFKRDNIRKNIFGFTIGADVNMEHWVVSARACWDIQTNHGDGTRSTPRYKNQWAQLTLGYRI